MRPCTQVLHIGPNFHGWTLPQYSLFGNVSGTLYVCTNVFGYTHEGLDKKFRTVKIKDFPLSVWNGYRWVGDTTENHPDIRRFILAYMREKSFVREHCVKCEHHMAKHEREVQDNIRALSSCIPQFKKHPQPLYGQRSGCYSQSRVDGRGYDISWEENIVGMTDTYGSTYTGVPVQYSDFKPVATFSAFEGYTDTPEAKRRDGMKVKQIKCRPTKDDPKEVAEKTCTKEDTRKIYDALRKATGETNRIKLCHMTKQYIDYKIESPAQRYDLTSFLPKFVKNGKTGMMWPVNYKYMPEVTAIERKLFNKITVEF